MMNLSIEDEGTAQPVAVIVLYSEGEQDGGYDRLAHIAKYIVSEGVRLSKRDFSQMLIGMYNQVMTEAIAASDALNRKVDEFAQELDGPDVIQRITGE